MKIKDDKEYIEKNKAIFELVSSEGWNILRDDFNDRIADIQSIANVDLTNPAEILNDIKVRLNVANELRDVIKKYEGQAKQFEQNGLEDNDLSSDERRGISHLKTD